MTTRRGLLAFLGLAPFAPALLKAAPSAAAPLAPLDLPGTIGFPGPRTIWSITDLTPEESRLLLTYGEVPGVVKDLDWIEDVLERVGVASRRIVNDLGDKVGEVRVLRAEADPAFNWTVEAQMTHCSEVAP